MSGLREGGVIACPGCGHVAHQPARCGHWYDYVPGEEQMTRCLCGVDELVAAAQPRATADIIAEGVANVSTALEPVLEAVVGYRAKCKAEGFSDEGAEAMAVEFHRILVAALVKAQMQS